MDAVCVKGDWDVVLALDGNNNIEGILIYHLRRYRGFNLILMPPLSSYSGIYFNYPSNLKSHSTVSFESRVTNKLLEQLPKYDFLYLQLSPDITNWLPLYWKDFKQSTRYTYKIDTMLSEEALWDNLKGNVRTNIRNSENACAIDDCSFEEFWKHNLASAKARNKTNPFNKQVLGNLAKVYLPKDQLQIKMVKSRDNGDVLGGAITVSDHNTRYYLAGFYYPNASPKYAFSYLLWNLIKSNPQQYFDMEGSIIPEIEHFFRSFGGELTPHFKIWKINNLLLKILFKIKAPTFLK